MSKETIDGQVLYLGRWVPRKGFRVFVYNSTGQKLCNTYDEYHAAITSGSWFAEKDHHKVFETEESNVIPIKKKRGRPCRASQ